MGYFKSIRQSIGSYMLLASKTQQPPVVQVQGPNTQPPTPPRTPLKPRLQLDPEPLSPTTRTTQWLDSSIPQKGHKEVNIHSVKGSRITKNSPKTSSKKPSRHSNYWGLQSLFVKNETEEAEVRGDEGDLEGDTLIENTATILQGSNFENDTTIIADIDDALEDPEVTAKLGDEPHDYAGWTEDEIWLLERINMLGSEPLLHLTWALDFPTLVPEIYTMDDSRVLIKAINGNTCHGEFAISPPHPIHSNFLEKHHTNLILPYFSMQSPRRAQSSSSPCPGPGLLRETPPRTNHLPTNQSLLRLVNERRRLRLKRAYPHRQHRPRTSRRARIRRCRSPNE